MKITVENLLKWRDVAEKARDMNYALQEVENDDFILIDRSTGEIFPYEGSYTLNEAENFLRKWNE